MRERLAAMEGILHVDSSREGTVLTAVLPVPDAPEAARAVVPGTESQVLSWPGVLKNRRSAT